MVIKDNKNVQVSTKPIWVTVMQTRRGLLSVVKSPTANCQTFSIKSAYILGKQTKKDAGWILAAAYQASWWKRQMIIDLKDRYFEETKNAIQPWCKSIRIKRYVSSNGNKMVLCLCRLDIEKIRKEFSIK